jgi:hypothetical protein
MTHKKTAHTPQNPGFDFSNAEFNGNVPDPQSFMGGVKYG